MCFSTAASSEKDQGSMNLASKTAPVSFDQAVQRCSHQGIDRGLRGAGCRRSGDQNLVRTSAG
jgi:hypothetical protein